MTTTFLSLTTRSTGLVMAIASATVFSTAGIFTNGVASGAWAVIFWRGLAAAGFALVYLMITGRLIGEIRSFGRFELIVTLMWTIGTACFISAFKLSSVANVAMIYAAAPFLAAFLAWAFLRERPEKRILIAATLALLGVGLIMRHSSSHSSLIGDMLALIMTVMMAASMVLYRAHPQTSATMPAICSCLLLLPISALFATDALWVPKDITVLVIFGLVFAFASITQAEASRRLPASETALLGTLEVPLAPLFAWMILAEHPSVQVLIGGAIICCALVWSQWKTATHH